MLSMTHEYALRAAVYLAKHFGEGPIGNAQISDATKVPTAYLSKILHNLAKHGIAVSRRGAGGGFSLRASPHRTNVLDVLQAADPISRIDCCPLGIASHCEAMCPMHAHIRQVQCQMEQSFADSTLEQLLEQSPRPLPMVDMFA